MSHKYLEILTSAYFCSSGFKTHCILKYTIPIFILWYNIITQNEIFQNKKRKNRRNEKAVVSSFSIPNNWFEKFNFFESRQLLKGLFNSTGFF